jgi:hypothetical protein
MNIGIPQMFSPPKMDKDKCSRGRSSNTYRYFLEVTKYLEENDDEQVTISQLVAIERMSFLIKAAAAFNIDILLSSSDLWAMDSL